MATVDSDQGCSHGSHGRCARPVSWETRAPLELYRTGSSGSASFHWLETAYTSFSGQHEHCLAVRSLCRHDCRQWHGKQGWLQAERADLVRGRYGGCRLVITVISSLTMRFRFRGSRTPHHLIAKPGQDRQWRCSIHSVVLWVPHLQSKPCCHDDWSALCPIRNLWQWVPWWRVQQQACRWAANE